MKVLLEVVTEREVDKRPAVGGEFHRGGQPALDDREVAGGQMLVQVVDVGRDLEPVARQRRRIDPRTGDDDHPQLRDQALGLGEARDHAPEKIRADA